MKLDTEAGFDQRTMIFMLSEILLRPTPIFRNHSSGYNVIPSVCREKERQEVEDQEELQKAVEESKSTMKWNITRKEESSDDEDEPEEKPEEGDAAASAAQANAAVTKDEPKPAEAPEAAQSSSEC